MKNKLKAFGRVFLTMIGMFVLFLAVIGIANCFNGIGQKRLGSIITLLFPLAVYFFVMLFNKKVNKLSRNSYGFGFKSFVRNSLLGIGIAILFMGFIILNAYLFFGIEIMFIGLKNNSEIPLMNLFFTLIIVGIWEEFYFRGLVFNTFLKSNFGFHASALISSILFSIVHWRSFDLDETSWLWYIGIVFVGYILVYIYAYTKSIWSVTFFHFLWNAINSFFDGENEIGLFKISNYAEHSKTFDNTAVVCLGLFLGIILFITRKGIGYDKIQLFKNQIINSGEV